MDVLLSFGPSFIMSMLGVLLLFAAIIGGGLEIKELKIPKIDKTPRILTALLGMGLVMCGGVVGLVAFANSAQPTPTMDMRGYVTVSAQPTMDMSGYVTISPQATMDMRGYVTVSPRPTTVVVDSASVVIHDHLGKQEIYEAVDIVIGGVKRGSIIIGTSRPSDSITITMAPGAYSYSLASVHKFESNSTIYYGRGQGTIEIAAGRDYDVGYRVSGQDVLLYLSATP
jgi:hypothetical protein